MRIAILAGSNRAGASSTLLSRYIQSHLQSHQCEVAFFDLFEKPIPFYSPDQEEPSDAHLLQLKETIRSADAIVLSSPEYHGSISGVLKNALDHLSREHFDRKLVLSVSSAGGAVGVTSLTHLQAMVRNLHGINCSDWISIGSDQRKFLPNGEPENPAIRERVNLVLHDFLFVAKKLQ